MNNEQLKFLNKHRVKTGFYASNDDDKFGFFFIKYKLSKIPLKVMSSEFGSNQTDWEHVSVSLPNRCPTWDEMCFIKDLFWEDDQTVVQFHPPKSEYVNNHKYCLHLWRNTKNETETPSSILVGLK